MNKKPVLILLLSFLALTVIDIAKAATIPSASLDKNTYLAGQTGYVSVSVYNDKSEKIRVTELSVTINYYYTDGTVYVQKFFPASNTLPDEIPAGETETYQIAISLPTNIAPGYINPRIDASTELWRPQSDSWSYSDHPSYTNLKLYVESPYKQSYETSQQQLQEQKTANQNLNNNVNMLAVTTIVFAAAAASLMFWVFTRRTRPIPQP